MDKKALLELDGLLADIEAATHKVMFCTLNISELTEDFAFCDVADMEKAAAFWLNRERINSFVEVQSDYNETLIPLIKKAQKEVATLIQE